MRGKLVGIKKRQENSIKDYLTLIKKDTDRDLMTAMKDGILPWQSDSSLESEGRISSLLFLLLVQYWKFVNYGLKLDPSTNYIHCENQLNTYIFLLSPYVEKREREKYIQYCIVYIVNLKNICSEII